MPTSAISDPTTFKPGVSDYETRIRSSFGRQGAMRLLGARLVEVRPGYCDIELPYRKDLTQQHGYIHAGIVGAIVDSAGGYAGYTLFPADSSMLTIEYKLNLLAPARGSSPKDTSSSPAARWRSLAERSMRKPADNALSVPSCSRR